MVPLQSASQRCYWCVLLGKKNFHWCRYLRWHNHFKVCCGVCSSSSWLWVGENQVTLGPDVFIRSQRGMGRLPGGQIMAWKLRWGQCWVFLAWHHCVLWPEWHACVLTPQHPENHGVSLRRDMKVKKKNKTKSMPSAERLSGEGTRARKQMVALSSLCTAHAGMCCLCPAPEANWSFSSSLTLDGEIFQAHTEFLESAGWKNLRSWLLCCRDCPLPFQSLPTPFWLLGHPLACG